MKVNIRISGGTCKLDRIETPDSEGPSTSCWNQQSLTNSPAFSVTVPDNSTVQDLRTAALVAAPIDLISTRSQTPYKLVYSGKKLDLADTLTSLGVTDASTVFMVSSDTNTHSPILTPAELSAPHTNNPPALSSTVKDETGATTTTKITKVRRKSSNKRRCSYLNCMSAPLRMVGDCVHCQGKFCSKHRLLENHHCTELQTCKEQMHERNANKLTSEQTIASKV
ncbi:GQ67_02327T0 [Komagataella phaffii]|nr:GQ67_02327T0 [Komagataella phaffii]AOA65636.1 GQ68_02920T0 [Komagataella phaffii GS115]